MDNVQYIAKNFECPICGKKFTQVWDAFGHLNDKHPAGRKEDDGKSCNACDRNETCAGNDSEIYPCPDYIEKK